MRARGHDRTLLLSTCVVAAIVLWAPRVGAEADFGSRTDTLSVLTYNVHGLPGVLAKDRPRDRMPTIGWLAHKYDVVLFQEDFEYHDELARQLRAHANGYVGNGSWSRPALVPINLAILPFTLLIPNFSPPYGAGISAFVDKDHDDGGAMSEAYRDCNGWFRAAGDCWSAKGFQRVTARTANGAKVHIYNTHTEAGSSKADAEVRRLQLQQLAEAIERLSPDRAVIVAGDFNVAFIRPSDRLMILEFRERLGLADTGAAPELRHWRERDVILYRSGMDATIEIEAVGEGLEFAGRRRALSDHAALYALFRLMPQ